MVSLVTGATGFMGKFLVERLVEEGEDVIATGRASTSPFKPNPRVKYMEMDVSDPLAVDRVLSRHRPEVVYHLAALVADVCEVDPSSCSRVNIRGTQNLIELSANHGVNKFVFMSSQSVYDPSAPEPVREEAAGHPVLFYGITKYSGEMMGLWYSRKGIMDFRALRPSVVFGPTRFRGPSAQFSSHIVEKALRGEEVLIRNPNDRVNYLYVRDAVEATFRLGKAKSAPSRIYNAGGFTMTVLEFAEMVRTLIPGLRYKVEARETVRYPAVIDNERAERELGWTPRYLKEESIRDYLETLRRGSAIFNL
jgi:UDP-glucose 4-epimerase